MEKLTLAGYQVLSGQINLDLIERVNKEILEEFKTLPANMLRTGADKKPGAGYQWPKTIAEIDKINIDRLAEHFGEDSAKFKIVDSWVLLQTDEPWIQNSVHDHAGGGGGVVVTYIMADPATDSISFFDDADNESKLSIMPGQTLAFSGLIKHKPNPTTNPNIKRISYNFTYIIEQEETEESKSRMEICNSCDRLMQPVKVCKECYCFMPAKVLIPIVECPLGKWGKTI